MIELGNQLALQFAIADKTDFLDIEDFHYLRIAKNAGGLRPIINLSFQVNEEDIIAYLNNGNIISLMYGIKEPTSDILQFEICGDSKSKEFRVGSEISLLGAMYNRGFTSQIKSKTYPNMYSYQALGEIATQNGLRFVTNVTKTNDKQTWYQSGLKDWDMAKFIASRAYKDPDTFFIFGFDNNSLYFYDIKEHLAQGPKWYLSVSHMGNDENSSIVNIGTYRCDDSQSGQNANFAGKNITNVSYNLDTGEFTNPKYSLKTLTTMQTNQINVSSSGCVNYNYHITTSDEHSFSVEAQNQNFRNNALFSSYRVHVPVAGQYRDFKLFDVVQLIPAESDKEAEGFYFITGIANEYKDNLYTTILTLNRESANGIKGDLIGG